MPLSRRDFLLVATTAAAAVASFAKRAPGSSVYAGALTCSGLVDALGRDTVRRIGARYRILVPAEDDARVLRAHLPVLRADATVRDDFTANRTIVVDGWLLSVTEARECALFSLRG